MLNTLLTSQISFSEKLTQGLLTFFIGLFVVFLGITIIVVFVTLAGKVFSSTEKQKVKDTPKQVEVKQTEEVAVSNEIPTHVKLAIIGAISAYYFENQKSNCEFVVKKIKRY